MSSAHLRVFENESNARPGPILNPRMMLLMQPDGLKRKVPRSLGLLSAGLTAAVSVSWRSRPRVLPVRELRECVSCAALATMRVPTRTPNRHAVLDSLGGGGYFGPRDTCTRALIPVPALCFSLRNIPILSRRDT
jgi:hypothetical protein